MHCLHSSSQPARSYIHRPTHTMALSDESLPLPASALQKAPCSAEHPSLTRSDQTVQTESFHHQIPADSDPTDCVPYDSS